MQVINGNRPKMSGAERAVITWLENDCPIPGIAFSGCHVTDRDGRGSQEADLVVFTPETAACVEVKGIRKRHTSGTLSCPVNGRWNLPGIEGDPVHVRAGDTNPLEQLAGVMYSFKHLAAQTADHDMFIAGLVLVVPNGGSLRLDKGPVPMPTGRDVLLGDDADDLFNWLRIATRRREQPWTAELVTDIAAALGMTDSVSRDELAAIGFPTAAAPAPSGIVVDLNPTVDESPLPLTQPIEPRPSAARAVEHDLGRPAETRNAAAIPPLYPAEPDLEVDARRRRPVRAAVLAGAAICLLGGGAWALSNGTNSQAQHGTTHPSTSTAVTPEQAAADAPAPPAEAIPAAPPPAPAAPVDSGPVLFPPADRPCYPFQTNC